MMDRNRIRAVYFDAVGTLLFPSRPALETYQLLAREDGSSESIEILSQRFRQAYNREEEIDRANRWLTDEPREVLRWRRIVEATLPQLRDPATGFQRLFAHYARADSWNVTAGAGQVLDTLTDRGLRLGMASNFDARLADVVRHQPALSPVRHALIISSQVGFRKPAQAFFERVIASADCPASAILFVGDDLDNDFEGARAAGLVPVLFDPQDRYQSIRPRIHSLLELLAD